jgi:hypothetical protein
MRVARKPHRCTECRERILPGEEYEFAKGLCDGHWWKAKTCMTCRRIRDSLFRCGWNYGEVWEIIHDEICGEPEDGECVCP